MGASSGRRSGRRRHNLTAPGRTRGRGESGARARRGVGYTVPGAARVEHGTAGHTAGSYSQAAHARKNTERFRPLVPGDLAADGDKQQHPRHRHSKPGRKETSATGRLVRTRHCRAPGRPGSSPLLPLRPGRDRSQGVDRSASSSRSGCRFRKESAARVCLGRGRDASRARSSFFHANVQSDFFLIFVPPLHQNLWVSTRALPLALAVLAIMTHRRQPAGRVTFPAHQSRGLQTVRGEKGLRWRSGPS